MSGIFSYHLVIAHRKEGLLFATYKFFFTQTFSPFSKSVCFALKPRFLIYGFALENYSGNVEQTNFSRIGFLWYLLPKSFILFLCILIIFIKSGNGNVNVFFHIGKLSKLVTFIFVNVLIRSWESSYLLAIKSKGLYSLFWIISNFICLFSLHS